MSELELFHQNFSEDNFESNCKENGFTYWYASYLLKLLEYENMTSFQKAINKATQTCITLNIPVIDNFIQEQRIVDGKNILDIKLSRFACYLTVMNADNKKVSVAKAQAYFAALAGAVQNYIEESNNIERLISRGELSKHELSLSGVVYTSGIVNYQFFQNAGYMGMYNKSITQLKEIRNIPTGRSPLDFMGGDELAANLFRLTQTELKIKNENIKGQQKLEVAAEQVGAQVRKAMLEISGIAPENLSKEQDIKEVKKELKTKNKVLKNIDKKKK